MVITDESLELIAKSFKNFKVLVLTSCEGFTADGLTAIASNCRFLSLFSFLLLSVLILSFLLVESNDTLLELLDSDW